MSEGKGMNWRRSMIGLSIALPLIALLGFGLTRNPSTILSPLPGRQAPDLALRVMGTDSVIDLSRLRGQVVVVNFWASWCIPCRAEHPELVAAKERWEGKGVVFLGVLYDDSESNARRWLEEFGGEKWPTLLDPRQRSAINYGVYGVPETFIIDQAGTVVHKQLSVITLDTLAHYIEPLLAKGIE
jgi:cytochrome c biogenesis protein CcmG/thiol:disulfide interchange protein DsbE